MKVLGIYSVQKYAQSVSKIGEQSKGILTTRNYFNYGNNEK